MNSMTTYWPVQSGISCHTLWYSSTSFTYDALVPPNPEGVKTKPVVGLGCLSDTLLSLLKGKIRDSTLTLYSESLRSLRRCVGDLPVTAIGPLNFEAFLSKRLEQVSAVRVNIELRALRALFTLACTCKLLEENPLSGVRPVRVPHREPRSLNPEEFHRLLGSIHEPDFRNFVIVAVCTALRAGELASLRWDDVDWQGRIVHLRNQDEFVTKGKRGRDIPLNRRAEQALRSLPHLGELVFINRRGGPCTVHSLSVRFKAYVRRAGLSEEIHLHSVRHTAASWMVERRVPLPHVKEILGHASITTTMIYVHSTIDHLRRSVCQLDEILKA